MGITSTGVMMLGYLGANNAVAAPNTFCTSGTTVYSGGSGGQWGTGDNWTHGQPSAQCRAVIPANITVTLSTVTQPGTYGNGSTGTAEGLTLMAQSRLIVEGVSSDVQGNESNGTNLVVGAGGLTIDRGASLDLNATGKTQPGSPPHYKAGGSANVTVSSGSSSSANLINLGSISASSTDPSWGESINVAGVFTNKGMVTVKSGLLVLQGQQIPYVLRNDGRFVVDTPASVSMIAGDGSSLTNSGTFTNRGATTLHQSMMWRQVGGGEFGHPVTLAGNETLQDSAGPAAFEINNCTVANLTGRVAIHQIITVVGGCSGTTLNLGTGSNKAPVTNNGVIVLNAPAHGSSAIISGAPLINHGVLVSSVSPTVKASNQVLTPLTNSSGGTVDVQSGVLAQTTGSTTTNNGTVIIGSSASWLLQSGVFSNHGTLSLHLQSATKFGALNLTTGGVFNAGGQLVPTLSPGYHPRLGTEFAIVTMNGGRPEGHFSSVAPAFRVDYSKESSATPYLGVIFRG